MNTEYTFFWWTAGDKRRFSAETLFQGDAVGLYYIDGYVNNPSAEAALEENDLEWACFLPKWWKAWLSKYEDEDGYVPVLNGALGRCEDGIVNGGPCFGGLQPPTVSLEYSIAMHDLAREGLATPEGRYAEGQLCEGLAIQLLEMQLKWLVEEAGRPLLDWTTCLPMVRVGENGEAETGHWVEGVWVETPPLKLIRLVRRWSDAYKGGFLPPLSQMIDGYEGMNWLDVHWWLSKESLEEADNSPVNGLYRKRALEEVDRNKKCKRGEKFKGWYVEGKGGTRRAGGPLTPVDGGWVREGRKNRYGEVLTAFVDEDGRAEIRFS